jgi:ABC-type nickel/cobalt efflux system permease component RcnA
LILLDKITLPTLLIAVAVSFLWGAMHAMTPGHGKTIVGAYLVGARGTAKHAFYLGLATTITHTAGVFALGLVTLFAARFILPEMLFPWLSFFSGLLVVGIGINLFVSRLRASDSLSRLSQIGSNYPHHHNTDEADHTLAHDHSYDHSHPHEHRHGQEHDLDHENGSALHSHLPPGADGAPVTWRSLLALGISGGLLPCPSALVVLLSAIALNRVVFGLVLVFAFSLGLAGVLTAIGILFVYAGRLFKRSPVQSRFIRLLPAASALFITLAGLGIAARALIETGLIEL